MITIKINYWDTIWKKEPHPIKYDEKGQAYTLLGCREFKSTEIVRTEDLSAETEDALFEAFYKLNNSLRYCNGSYYTFVVVGDEVRYNAWRKSLDNVRSFNLYYGNGVVD